MLKRFVTALLVAAMLLLATSISWGAGQPNPTTIGGSGLGGVSTTGATWE